MTFTDHIPSQVNGSELVELLKLERQAAVLSERRRFAAELHDTVAGDLQVAILHLQDATQTLAIDPAGAAGALHSIAAAEDRIRACWTDARRSAAALRPAELDQRGLTGALAEYVARVDHAAETHVTFSTCGTPRPLGDAAELTLARAGQEAINNALRHAAAQAISVELSYDADAVRLDVTDNGLGFDLRCTIPGTGLLALRDRASQVGADLSILSEPSHGTEVILTLPYVKQAEELMIPVQVEPSPVSETEVFVG